MMKYDGQPLQTVRVWKSEDFTFPKALLRIQLALWVTWSGSFGPE
jgi:hypothetical protein